MYPVLHIADIYGNEHMENCQKTGPPLATLEFTVLCQDFTEDARTPSETPLAVKLARHVFFFSFYENSHYVATGDGELII